MSDVPYLRIHIWERPWWLLKLIGRWHEIEAEPPPDATFADVIELAEKFREHENVRVEVVHR